MPSKIRWTDETWNPTTGCHKVSDGCRYCYAEVLSTRFGWTSKPWTAPHAAENVTLHPERLSKPYSWRRPQRVFVDSMSDLFHEQVPDAFLDRVFAVMAELPQHIFQILTKRPARMAGYLNTPERAALVGTDTWPLPNVWVGTSVEDSRVLHRVDALRSCPAAIRFLSCEPLIGPLDGLDLSGIGWVIVGGESGPHQRNPETARPLDMAWARAIRDRCQAAGVPFFFKQDSDVRSEQRPWLVERDGSHARYEQLPEIVPAGPQQATLFG